MFVLGLQGSPRKKGNTAYLLSAFLDEAEKLGAQTHLLEVTQKNILSCKGCGSCEKSGTCVIRKDDVASDICVLLKKADVIVMATPIYFYNTPAQLKALIDRSQVLWSRKYIFNLKDPLAGKRVGFLLSLGATRGKNLFDGVKLTAKYFFDAVNADFKGSLVYWHIENPSDMQNHETAMQEVKDEVKKLLTPFLKRKKILFACRENACRSQIAGAFARYFGGDKLDVLTAGSTPSKQINPFAVEVMEEKKIDMAYIVPESIENVISKNKLDIIITMGCNEECPFIPGIKRLDWDLPDPAGKPIEFMRDLRDEIEKKVLDFIKDL